MWSIRFFELLFCFHPRHVSCYVSWNNASSCCTLILVWASKYTFVSASFSQELRWWCWDVWLQFVFAFQVKMVKTWLSMRRTAASVPACGSLSGWPLLEERAQNYCICAVYRAQTWAGVYTRYELTSCSWLGQSINLCVGGVDSWEVWA